MYLEIGKRLVTARCGNLYQKRHVDVYVGSVGYLRRYSKKFGLSSMEFEIRAFRWRFLALSSHTNPWSGIDLPQFVFDWMLSDPSNRFKLALQPVEVLNGITIILTSASSVLLEPSLLSLPHTNYIAVSDLDLNALFRKEVSEAFTKVLCLASAHKFRAMASLALGQPHLGDCVCGMVDALRDLGDEWPTEVHLIDQDPERSKAIIQAVQTHCCD